MRLAAADRARAVRRVAASDRARRAWCPCAGRRWSCAGACGAGGRAPGFGRAGRVVAVVVRGRRAERSSPARWPRCGGGRRRHRTRRRSRAPSRSRRRASPAPREHAEREHARRPRAPTSGAFQLGDAARRVRAAAPQLQAPLLVGAQRRAAQRARLARRGRGRAAARGAVPRGPARWAAAALTARRRGVG